MQCSKTYVRACDGNTHSDRQGSTLTRTTLDRLFIAHPRTVNGDYLAHAAVAMRYALLLLGAGLAALVHAVIPALFETTASSMIKKLHAEMMSRSTTPQSG
jgi:uncharacterized protein DUF6356